MELLVKRVVDAYNRMVDIDEGTKKLYSYDNDKQIVTYNAEIVEDGKRTGFWTEYSETGTVDDIETRLSVWNNKVSLIYSASVGFNAAEKDADKAKWKKLVQHVSEHPDTFFTASGNFRSSYLVSDKEIEEIIK